MAASETLVVRARAAAQTEITPTVLVLAAALPIVFLHVNYQPGFSLRLGSTSAGVELSDIAVIAVAVAALWQGLRSGFGTLRAALSLWIAGAALVLWIVIRSESLRHLVTAAKFAEYALLALSVPLLLRRRNDWELVAAVIVIWSGVATLVGLLQFFGVDIAAAWPAGRRQPSFLGHNDFAALSALAIGIGLAAIIFERRRIGWAAIVSGVLGATLAGATAGLIGIAAGACGLLYAAWRRRALTVTHVALCGVVVAIVAAGVFTLRAGDYDAFVRFLHIRRNQHAQRAGVETYAQHTLLAYIGYRIWRAHPVAGAGWQGSTDAKNVDPQLPAARKQFPNVSPISFPTSAHEWGVQDAYVQALADLGVIGLVLWLAPFAIALVLALRANVPPGAIASFGVLAAAGLWAGQGLVAGLPLDGVMWLAFGLAATAAANARG
jgi:O-Antigen ligase